jgi:5-methylcytosine-specific restriction endonuclease McrBC regulatory subunit McrC
MLERIYLSTEAGGHHQDAFLWDMNFLFEDAVRGIFETWSDVELLAPRAPILVTSGAGTVRARTRAKPDYVLNTPAGVVVLDAKYKETGAVGSSDDVEVDVLGQRLRVTTRDIYQVVAYGQHDQLRPSQLGLVYPIVLSAGQVLPKPHVIRGFSHPIRVHFVDIGPSAAANVNVFRDQLRLCLGGWPSPSPLASPQPVLTPTSA